ncbi:MAG: glycosyltransferase family 4 protein [Verrucomicrobiota bacterium]
MRFLAFELETRLNPQSPWETILHRNELFQDHVLKHLQSMANPGILFSYSYAARRPFRWAKKHGCTTILGQIDPGPEEERIVADEHKRYSNLRTRWAPAPASYWDMWREEIELADRIVVNSEWSKECLVKVGVPEKKMHVIPLIYTPSSSQAESTATKACRVSERFQVLYLGQINLRKGVGRLLKAMELLQKEAFDLVLVGPTEIHPSAWEAQENVIWKGAVARSEVDALYASADAFILPTLSDGYALTQLEAIANGLPVIASQHCGRVVSEGQNGFLLDSLSPKSIADTIRKAADRLPLLKSQPNSFTLQSLGRSLSNLVKES